MTLGDPDQQFGPHVSRIDEGQPFVAAMAEIVGTVLADPGFSFVDYFETLSERAATAAVGAIVREAVDAPSLDVEATNAILYALATYLGEGKGHAQRSSRAACLVAARDMSSDGDAAARVLVAIATLDAYLATFENVRRKTELAAPDRPTRDRVAAKPSRQSGPSATTAAPGTNDGAWSAELGEAGGTRLWSGRVMFESAESKGMLLEVAVLVEAANEFDARQRFAMWATEKAGSDVMFANGDEPCSVARVDVLGPVCPPPLGRVVETARHTFLVRDTAAFLGGCAPDAKVDW